MNKLFYVSVMIVLLVVRQMQVWSDETLWKNLHVHYESQEWVHKPSIFAETAVQFFPKTGTVLELGAGIGQDSIYFASLGYLVIASDIETGSLSSNISHQSETIRGKISVHTINLSNRLPFVENSIDVVYAHLSLHYFDKNTTKEIFGEIARILKPGGILAFLSNSKEDPEYGTGIFLEDDFFLIGKVKKRYMDLESLYEFTKFFNCLLMDDQGETYKDQAKGVKFLIRYVGKK